MSIAPLVECAGIALAGAKVPQFSVLAGEMVNITLPEHWDEKPFLNLLTGNRACSEIQLSGPVALANELTQHPLPNRTMLGRWRFHRHRRKSVAAYLRYKGLSESEITEAKQKTNLDLAEPISHLNGNGKLRLSVLLALREAQTIIFSDAGVDPVGQLAVFNDVVEALPGRAAIHLCYPQIRGSNSVPVAISERFPAGISFSQEIEITRIEQSIQSHGKSG